MSMSFRNLLFAFALGLLLVAAGCQNRGPEFDPYAKTLTLNDEYLQRLPSTNQVNPEWLEPPSDFFTLGPGDTVEVEILGQPDTLAPAKVGPDGLIYYNLLPGVDVWGLTLQEAANKLEREFQNYLKEQPDVSIILRGIGSKRVWLLGRLASPGVYVLDSPKTVLETISMAGGILQNPTSTQSPADLQHSFILREGERVPVDLHALLEKGDMSQNVYMRSGDLLYIRSAESKDVYVLGAVASPNLVPYRAEMTLVSAVASAGGPIAEAYLSHVAIVRGSLSEPRIAVLDYQQIVTGKQPDVLLEPQDIVFVPFSPYRYITRFADQILRSFVRTIAINEGSRAVIDAARPTQVTVPGFSDN